MRQLAVLIFRLMADDPGLPGYALGDLPDSLHELWHLSRVADIDIVRRFSQGERWRHDE
jgi:hypothetical protein